MSLSFQNSDFLNYKRRVSDVVKVGDIALGGTNPIRIQTMANTPTLDTRSTVEQCIRVFNAGADFMRITAPSVKDAENLAVIKQQLRNRGYQKPLVADIHFNPTVAEVAARIVEKVRINPGNYADKKVFRKMDFTDSDYLLELERVRERILPLLSICKQYGTAIRVGVNHGSLSDRIMSRFGDTPEGMAESAMEFLRIFENEGFRNTVISMKSSNTRVMVYSTRLLIEKMYNEGMNYPVHLGVTEAGIGEDGIIKSAVGISALLADGIGETIRVSLTGDPEQEIPVAQKIVQHFQKQEKQKIEFKGPQPQINSFEYNRRKTQIWDNLGGNKLPIVVITPKNDNSKASITRENIDAFYSGGNATDIFSFNEISVVSPDCQTEIPKVLVANSSTVNCAGEIRKIISILQQQQNQQPLIVRRKYQIDSLLDFQITASCDFGALLNDGFVDGIWLENISDIITDTEIYKLALNMLQASRLRMSKTDYISCPSCGRTQFDLTSTTEKIKSRTSHLNHLKIGIMGCIVNGPGEMADADYGYVGTGPGKITLYKGNEIVKRNIPESEAVDELIQVIKLNGDWKEPENKKAGV